MIFVLSSLWLPDYHVFLHAVDKKIGEKKKGEMYLFLKKWRQEYKVKCMMGVVYMLPLTCGHVYIGQTGCCINTRLKEHKQSLVKK